MKRLQRHGSMILLIILVALTLVLWFPTRTLPYWWDSAGFIMQLSHHYLLSNFSPPANSFSDFAHPPLLSLLIAASWKIFGQSLLVSHIVYFPFVLLCVISTFFVGKELIKGKVEGSLVGFTAAVLLLFTPVFLAQVGIIYLEVPSTALAVTSYLFYLKKRYAFYAVSASMMVLIRESTIIIVFLFFFISLYERYKRTGSMSLFYQEKRDTLLQLLPIIALSAWFVFHRLNSGWWLTVPGRVVGDPNIFLINILQIASVFTFLFVSQWRFLLFIIFIVCFLGSYFYSEKTWKRQRAFWSLRKLPLLLIPVLFLMFFGKTEFLPRYMVIALPFFYLSSLFAVLNVFSFRHKGKGIILIVLFSLVCASAFRTQWDMHRQIKSYHFSPLEDNLEYLDVVSLGRQVSVYMEENKIKDGVYTSFPMTYMLNMPYQGFVNEQIRSKECSRYKTGDRITAVIFHLLSPGSQNCLKMLQDKKPHNVKTFSKNGKHVLVALYK